jgi:hypothetical protein
MGRYSDANLIKYEEAIQLHFDTKGKIAWFTLKNYGVVFHMFPWAPQQRSHQVVEITIGVPAGSKFDAARLLPLKRTIDISAMLDVFDVIKFQVKLLEDATYPYLIGNEVWIGNRQVAAAALSPRDVMSAHMQIEATVPSMGFASMDFSWYSWKGGSYQWATSRDFFSMTQRGLERLLQPPQGAPWIARQIRETRNQANGLTAYFPNPNLIVEEQRTLLIRGDTTGKTKNSDPRSIKPIYLNGRDPFQSSKKDGKALFSYEEFLGELDKDRITAEDTFIEDRPVLNRQNFANGQIYLHKHLQRITCYGFRGDKRSPAEVSTGIGFLPGVTRTDVGLADKYHNQGKFIERALRFALEAKDGGVMYREVMKKLDVLTLGVYTADADFKGFISMTTSTAIAKHFANFYAKVPNLYDPVYCYALRCKGAFHLPTEAIRKQDDKRGWAKGRDADNAMVHNAEQEVAMAGGVGWGDVVGVRKFRIDKKGQFFCGPVFLSDLLREEYQAKLPKTKKIGDVVVKVWRPAPDNHAFDELFELFSGRSQGTSFEICWSYEEAPFDCPKGLMLARELMEDIRQKVGW